MSVAFRRESDEEHLEPKFELPIPAGPNLVTWRGLVLIIERIADLKARLERSQDERVHEELQRDLRYWSTRQITAEVVPLPAGDRVELSTRVTILMKGRPRTFQIVGDDEADPAAGLILFNAPLSRVIAGAEPGDVLNFAEVTDAIEILDIQVV